MAPEDDVLRVCSILESIAEHYEPGSPEHEALRDAAFAFTIVQQKQQLKAAFERLRSTAPLTEEMKAQVEEYLQRNGIDPDSFDDD